jgi:hypothetical protein
LLDARAALLRAHRRACTPGRRRLGWRGLIELNLGARLRRLVDVCVETAGLRQHIDAGVHGKLPTPFRPAGRAAAAPCTWTAAWPAVGLRRRRRHPGLLRLLDPDRLAPAPRRR